MAGLSFDSSSTCVSCFKPCCRCEDRSHPPERQFRRTTGHPKTAPGRCKPMETPPAHEINRPWSYGQTTNLRTGR